MLDFKKQYDLYFNRFELKLNDFFNKLDCSTTELLVLAMKYAVLDGGKRIRPVLCYATCDALGVSLDEADNLAIALELIHSYSLVHDDLPAMDNDDYRRGKFSTHKKFGEANAILCGDALLNLAIEIALNKSKISSYYIDALKVLFDYSGYKGMILGQVLDLDYEGKTLTEKDLYDVIINKTAKLISAPILMASKLSGNKYENQLKEYAYNIGVLFQITDDIMDVEGSIETIGKTPKKDAEADKLTSVKILGLKGAKERAKTHYNNAITWLTNIPNSEFLRSITNMLYNRKV